MPSFKISQLSELTSADDADFFEIVDDSELTISDKNKRITFENLKLSIYSDSRIDTAFPAWNVATTYDSANNPQYVSYQSRLYQFTKSSGTDTGTTPGTDVTVWDAVGGVKFFAPPATDAEALAATATNRYVTPANLAALNFEATTASNGLTEVGNDVQLGGALASNTAITLGTYTLDINLDSTGTFAIQDGGTDVFTVNASGNVNVQNNELYFGGSLFIQNPNGSSLGIGDGVSDLTAITNAVIIGQNATTTAGSVVSIGQNNSIGGSFSVLIGRNGNAQHQNCVALGNGATTTANRQFVVGSGNYITDAYIGAGVQQTSGFSLSLQNNNITSGTTNTASGSFTIQSGQSTGSADGGNLIFKISDGGASGTAQNSQSTVFELGASKIGMYGVTPTARATTGIGAATFTANTSGISDDTATWGGYTIGQVVQALQTIGILT